MDEAAREALRDLVRGERLLSLAVLVDGAPVIGVLPFVATPDGRALVVQAAGLARHSKGMTEDAPYEAAIHAGVPQGGDPLQAPRLIVRGRVEWLDDESPEYRADAAGYLERFPSAEMTAQLPDFRFYRLRLESGRLITGFARALNLSRDHFEGLAE
jgi:putative heme iron utilization protein